MSNDGNRTVFQPSPLQPPGGFTPLPPPSGGFGGPPSYQPPPPPPPPSSGGMGASPYRAPIGDDDVPQPATPRARRNVLIAEAAPILALAASIRSGRARQPLQQFHTEASRAVAAFDRTIGEAYPAEVRQRATYALCATIDDIAQNLPGIGAEGSEWARRSLVVQMFRENIGGDRFWQIAEEMLARPSGNGDMIELLHACLGAGFEGRFRQMPDRTSRLQEIMARLYGALDGVRSLSDRELVAHWRGVDAPRGKVGAFSQAALAAAVAAVLLLLLFIALRVLLMQSGRPAWDALATISPSEPLRLSRGGAGLPPSESGQAQRLETFLAPEIAQHLVAVDRDAATVRVRTTVGQLFRSGSDQLESGRAALFQRIGEAVDKEPGPVRVEGHADSDRPTGLTFPDNTALSAARAQAVAALLKATMADPARVTARGLGDSQPIASNATADGKSLNRRVEVILARHD